MIVFAVALPTCPPKSLSAQDAIRDAKVYKSSERRISLTTKFNDFLGSPGAIQDEQQAYARVDTLTSQQVLRHGVMNLLEGDLRRRERLLEPESLVSNPASIIKSIRCT
jgi:hypothetical protein